MKEDVGHTSLNEAILRHGISIVKYYSAEKKLFALLKTKKHYLER